MSNGVSCRQIENRYTIFTRGINSPASIYASEADIVVISLKICTESKVKQCTFSYYTLAFKGVMTCNFVKVGNRLNPADNIFYSIRLSVVAMLKIFAPKINFKTNQRHSYTHGI